MVGEKGRMDKFGKQAGKPALVSREDEILRKVRYSVYPVREACSTAFFAQDMANGLEQRW